MTWQHAWKFRLLLVALLALLAVQPVLGTERAAHIGYTVAWSVVLIGTILVISDIRWQRWLALALAVPIFPGIWSRHVLSESLSETVELPAFSLAVVLFGIVAVMLMRHLVSSEVTADHVAGAVCAYLFIGLGIGVIYAVIETVRPHSFQVTGNLADALADPVLRRQTLAYFSFVTLTTAGYGDIVPATPLTRTLAMLEAVLGQFYLAVLVAGLVGIRVSRRGGSGSG